MKLNYSAPTIDVIEVEVEGIMAYSSPKSDMSSTSVSIERTSAPESFSLGGFSRDSYNK